MPDFQPILDPSLQQLAEFIDANGGVLFIGPGLSYFEQTEELMLENFRKKIPIDFGIEASKKAEESTLNYVVQAALNKVKNSSTLPAIKGGYKDYFQKHFKKKQLYKLISKLNFRLIINANPDEEVFTQLDGPKIFSYYECSNDSGRMKEDELTTFSFNMPGRVVYNIFGSFRSPNSVRLCESDFIELVRCIHTEDPQIPPVIRSYIASQVPLVFIGFSYHDWYLKILLNVIGIEDKFRKEAEQQRLIPEAIGFPISIHSDSWPAPDGFNKLFYEGQFRFSFASHNPEEYIRTLLHHTPARKHIVDGQKIKPLKTVLIFNDESSEDREVKNKFVQQLNVLQGTYIEEIWSLDMPSEGKNRKDELETKLSQATMAIFLLSSDFFGKAVCMDCLKALKQEPKVMIVPILIRPFLYKDVALLKDLEVLPTLNGKAVPLANSGNFDGLSMEICQAIQSKIKEQQEF